ncbi:nitroreductase family protein [Sediminitomix flava]|uniref:Nitroreductase n=1 Tax=Sediminitomix flava TaxID=379075 RepID=A0A315ZHD0_SEDFL|nr:nitroreductase family protein [Sediminitomix flava]PWJ44603.1 nitroreductase [Sediminitomix flava]
MLETKNKDLVDSFNQIVQERRSVRVYDTEFDFDHEAVQRSLELAILSPNSSNMQLWEFYRIKSERMKAAMVPICLNQSAAKTASELVVAVIRPDLWKERAKFNYDQLKIQYGDRIEELKKVGAYYGKLMPLLYRNDSLGLMGSIRKMIFATVGLFRPSVRETSKSDVWTVLHKTCGLACMTFMYAMKAEGYDTCPMEGFDSVRLKRLLRLPSSAGICMVISCGKGKQEGIWGKRLRVSNEQIIKTI